MAVSKRLRYEILRRDNHACRYCGGAAPDAVLTVDHVVAVALGGSDDPSNLVAACKDCNSGKSASPADAALVADVNQDAIRWAQAMQRATEMATAARDRVMACTKAVLNALNDRYPPADAPDTIETFLRLGLTPNEIEDSAWTAAAAQHINYANEWRYFCGVCKRKIERRREQAAALIAQEEHRPVQRNPEIDYAVSVYGALALVCDGAANA